VAQRRWSGRRPAPPPAPVPSSEDALASVGPEKDEETPAVDEEAPQVQAWNYWSQEKLHWRGELEPWP